MLLLKLLEHQMLLRILSVKWVAVSSASCTDCGARAGVPDSLINNLRAFASASDRALSLERKHSCGAKLGSSFHLVVVTETTPT